MRKLTVFFLILGFFAPLTAVPVWADEQGPESVINQTFTASVGEAGLAKDLSFSVFDNELQVGIPAGRLTAPTIVTLSKIPEPAALPTGFTMPGTLYQIDIPAVAFKTGEYYVSLKSSGSAGYKQIYFFDKNSGWRPLVTNENFAKGVVSTKLTMPFMRLGVFENPQMLVKGNASWYRYKNGNYAASPDFPAGTRLRVINQANNKFVDVTVNDFGPDRTKHPDRVVDLDAVAFARLAPLGQGTVSVVVEKLTGSETTMAKTPASPSTTANNEITAHAALVFNSLDQKVLWSKNPDDVIPLASLTKLVAVKTFLDTKPNLEKVVSYSVQDEKYNALYVNPTESARLKLQDRDQVKVKDLVFASLVGSTNNTVESLVRVSGMTRENFIKKMNQNVKGWGATHTQFVEPSGLSVHNVTTAAEYAIIARRVFLDDFIAQATVRPSYTVTTLNTHKSFTFKNTNLLARDKDSSLLGSKTGYLVEAGYCLATKWPTTKDKNIIIVLFGAPTRQASVDDTKKLVTLAEKAIQ